MTHAVRWSALARRTGIRNRNRYSVRDLIARWTAPRCGGRRGSFGASGTRRFRPGDSERGQRDAKPRVGYGVVRGTGGERSRPLRWRRAVEVVRAAKERSGCTGIRGRGNKKAPVGLHAGRGFRFRETCGEGLAPRVSRSMSGRPSSRVHRSWAANRSTATLCLLDRGCMPPGPAPCSGAAGALRSLGWVRLSASPYSRSGRVSAPLPEGRRSLLAAAEMSTGATRLPAPRMPSNRGGGDCTRDGGLRETVVVGVGRLRAGSVQDQPGRSREPRKSRMAGR